MLEVAKIYLGNLQKQPELRQLINKDNSLEINLDPSDRFKGRIHTKSITGKGVGIIKDRDRPLESGDIFQSDSGIFILIHLKPQQLLIIDLNNISSNILPSKLVQLGHLLGNHHYPIAVENNKIYVQLITDARVLENQIKDLHISQLQISYEHLPSDPKITFSTHKH
ncbi:hypothetical protein NIES4102_38990 [Chondrocystis sp. NIES-4102]|nr:hypothetical protein NIES4102_38990 [Chondrocystis sp. NIES-4102]